MDGVADAPKGSFVKWNTPYGLMVVNYVLILLQASVVGRSGYNLAWKRPCLLQV